MTEQTNDATIDSISSLRNLYGEASERIQKLKFHQLDEFSRQFIEDSPLCFLATSNQTGVDCSPRGGDAGFVKVVDEHIIHLPDWAGNIA